MRRVKSPGRKRAAWCVTGILCVLLLCAALYRWLKAQPYLSMETMTLYTSYEEMLELCGTEEPVVWKSSDDGIASVEDGRVKAKSEGEARITAVLGEREYTCVVEVRQALSPYYGRVADREAEWLESLQLSDGSFACYDVSDGTARINPYFASYTALALLVNDRDGVRREKIEGYLDWHFSHMNRSDEDIHGIDGTIYDYEAELCGHRVMTLTSRQTYDSVDSYSAVFLTLLLEYAKKYGQEDYLYAHKEEIDRLVQVLFSTVENGYSVAAPEYPYKLLMDNAEVYRGLKDAMLLYETVFTDDVAMAALLAEAVENFEGNFDTVWWSGEFYHSVLRKDHTPDGEDNGDWQELYPFSIAQLFPVMFDIHSREDEASKAVYDKFCKYWNWENMDFKSQTDGNIAWSLAAYAAAKMGDYGRLKKYLQTFDRKITDRDYPYYSGDSVWVVLACENAYAHYRGLKQ